MVNFNLIHVCLYRALSIQILNTTVILPSLMLTEVTYLVHTSFYPGYMIRLLYAFYFHFQSEYIGLTMYDLMLEEDHDGIRKKVSEAEAKSLTRTTKLGKDGYRLYMTYVHVSKSVTKTGVCMNAHCMACTYITLHTSE